MPDKQPKLAMYPIFLYEEGMELPKEGKYYLITASGIYFRKETKVGSGLVKVQGIPWLEKVDSTLALSLPKIPGLIIAQAHTFFAKVFQVHKAEAYVTLMYSSKLNQFRLWCPKQTVTAASVNYDREDQPSFSEREAEEWNMVGTIHSHCDFGAYHSGTDVGDEASFDGIHITLGHVNRKAFSMAVSVAFNNSREQMEPENCCLGVVRVGNKYVSSSKHMTWGDATYFESELSEEEAQQLVADTEVIEKEWMPKVEHGWKGVYSSGSSFFSSYETGTGSGDGGWYENIKKGRRGFTD